MQIIDMPEYRSDAWRALRHTYFNASAASVLFNRHPYQTAAEYALEKLADEAPPDLAADNRAMQRGHHLEDGVATWYAELTGDDVRLCGQMFANGRMLCTPDRIIANRDTFLEIKTTSSHVDEPMTYWLDQCQAILACTGRDSMTLAWIDGSMDIDWCEVDRNDTLIATMLAEAESFMTSIEMGVMPEWVEDTLTASQVAVIHPEPEGEVELGEDQVRLLAEYVELKDRVKVTEARIDEIKDELARWLGPYESASFDGEVVLTFKAAKPRDQFDMAAFREDNPALASLYTKPGRPSRTFLPKKKHIPAWEGES